MPTKNTPAVPFAIRRWAETLEEVAQFKARHGRLPGDTGVEPRESALRQWIGRQRSKESAGELTQTQVDALNTVDGDWRADRQRLPWEDKLTAAILEYQSLGRIPGNNEPVGSWLRQQRSRMSTGSLDTGQLEALDESLPGWRNLDRIRWFEQASALTRYVDQFGRLPSGRTKDAEGRRLYTWLARQRKRLREGILHQDYVGRLDADIPAWRGAGKPTGRPARLR